jgi:hypothetical protein
MVLSMLVISTISLLHKRRNLQAVSKGVFETQSKYPVDNLITKSGITSLP